MVVSSQGADMDQKGEYFELSLMKEVNNLMIVWESIYWNDNVVVSDQGSDISPKGEYLAFFS